MIDLHMHTKYSDGQFYVEELLNILNDKGIKYAAITDHNSVGAHLEIREKNLDKLYNGKMITGVEIQTLVDSYLIEVLVYNFDIDRLNEYIENTRVKFWEFHKSAYQKLLKKADSLGLKYIEPERELQNGYYCNMKFQEAIAACLDYNKNIVDEKILTDHLHFYRNEFQNPKSEFFIDNTEAFPRLEEVIKVAHECGGLVFLAHIDEYQAIKDKMEFLEMLVSEYDIDGIECFHPVISKENRTKYMEFAKKNNLFISAGSDFHGEHLPHRRGITTEATLEEISWLKDLK